MSASSSILTTYSFIPMIPKNTKNTFEKYSDASDNTDFMSAPINVFSLSTLLSTSVLSSPQMVSRCLQLKSDLSRIGMTQRKSKTFNPFWVLLISTTASFPTIPTSWFPFPASLARVLLVISQLKLVNHSKPSSPLSHPSVTNVRSQVISHATPS